MYMFAYILEGISSLCAPANVPAIHIQFVGAQHWFVMSTHKVHSSYPWWRAKLVIGLGIIVPDRIDCTPIVHHTALSGISNRIVGKILLCTIWYHALFFFRSGVYKYCCSACGTIWWRDEVRSANCARIMTWYELGNLLHSYVISQTICYRLCIL